jgi:hypothetical protein
MVILSTYGSFNIMNTLKINLALSLAAAAMLSLAPAPAEAQSGSRLCGWITVQGPQKVGLLYEARTKDASYHKQCDEAISKMESEIAKNPKLKALQWQKVKRETCESVGNKGFVNAGESADICDKMQAKTPYQVTKSGAAAAVYSKK